MRLKEWLRPRLRLWSIYNELGYNPWRRSRKARRQGRGVYMGARETIPFLNDDAKRTFSHLLLRPGYMMRDYILRGEHERYLAPFTALLVFYSVFTLLIAIVNPGSARKSFGDDLIRGFQEATAAMDSTDLGIQDVHFGTDSVGSDSKAILIELDSAGRQTKTGHLFNAIFKTMTEAIIITRLDLYPEAADTPWKESLAAVEGDIRSKGIPLFLGNFLLLWLAMAILLRKYQVSVSGAAAASAYVLCQFCIFMFLALLLSFGEKAELGVLLMGVLLFLDYRQMLGISNKPAFKLTVKTGLVYLAVCVLFYILLAAAMVLIAYLRVKA